jgi:hypothetical protein
MRGMATFEPGKAYTRSDVYELLAVPEENG